MLRKLMVILNVSLAGCATAPEQIAPGYTKAQVRAAWGEPDTMEETTMGPDLWIYRVDGAECGEYSLIFDNDGRVEKIQRLDGR